MNPWRFSWLALFLLLAAGFAGCKSDNPDPPPLVEQTPPPGWRRHGFDPGSTFHYPVASSPNPGGVALLWKEASLGGAFILSDDLDGDGDSELVVSDGTTDLRQANGTALTALDGATGATLWSVPTSANLLYIGDVNGNGAPEIFTATKDSSDHLKADLHAADGTFDRSLDRGVSGNDSVFSYLTHIGRVVLAGYHAGFSLTPRGVGAFRYAAGTEETFADKAGTIWGRYAYGDMNGDGKLELAQPWGTSHNGKSINGATDGDLYGILLSVDLGTQPVTLTVDFQTIVTTWDPTTNPNGLVSTMMPDLDGDGLSELLFIESHFSPSYPGTTHIYRVDLAGSLLGMWSGGTDEDLPLVTVVNDLNGDGVKEIAFSSVLNDTLTLVDGKDLTTFLQSADAGRVLGSADWDGDGRDEILTHQTSTGLFRVLNAEDLSETGSYAVGSFGLFAVLGYNYNRFLVSDLDGDGLLEAALAADDGLYVLQPQ